MTPAIDWTDIQRGTAARAAERELRILKQALAAPAAEALDVALDAHLLWLSRLIGCGIEHLSGYGAWRREMVRRFGLLPDVDFLTDATEGVMHLIRKGEATHAV